MEIKTSMGYPEILCSNHKAYSDDIYKSFVNDYRSMPSGMPSLGVLFPLFYDLLVKKHEWDLPKLMKKLSFNPANMAQIYPKKGTIAVGSDADLVIFDPNGKPRTVTSSLAKQYNAWSDFTTNVEIKEVLLRGTTVVKNGKLVNEDKRIGQALCDTNI